MLDFVLLRPQFAGPRPQNSHGGVLSAQLGWIPRTPLDCSPLSWSEEPHPNSVLRLGLQRLLEAPLAAGCARARST